MLYSLDMGGEDTSTIVSMLMKELKVTRKSALIALEKVNHINSHKAEFDALIASTAKEYSLERIYSVERNILRLALFEILYDADVPPKVAISEAIRLAKKFSTSDATSFVNGILDKIYKETNGAESNDATTFSEGETA